MSTGCSSIASKADATASDVETCHALWGTELQLRLLWGGNLGYAYAEALVLKMHSLALWPMLPLFV